MNKELTIVIPHYNGINILRDCLDSIYKNNFKAFEVLLIDNGSTDGSQGFTRQNFQQVRIIQNEVNRGYAGACNQGIEFCETDFVLLLNNDTVMPENFLDEMLISIKQNDAIACVQPKIMSIQNKEYFDYSGAAGGEMDILGYPFARGRIFDNVEKDESQYDDMMDTVFWTSGCALLLRKQIVSEIGVLDEDFFAHQEEIDLNWRAQLAGYKNCVVYSTHIYHYSGYTLASDNQRKMYLNHRNNLIMMVKNYSFFTILILFPIRIMFEFATVLMDSFLWQGKRAKAVLKALLFIFIHPVFIIKKRRDVQKIRKVTDWVIMKNMYHGSIVIDHFIKRLSPYACVSRFRH